MEPAVFSPGMLCGNEFIESEASTLFHSFENEAKVHREFNPQIIVCLKDVKPSQDRTFVIRRSSSDELAVISDGQSEWIGVPSIALESLDSKQSVPSIQDPANDHGTHGLNVKVAIKQNRFLSWILANLS